MLALLNIGMVILWSTILSIDNHFLFYRWLNLHTLDYHCIIEFRSHQLEILWANCTPVFSFLPSSLFSSSCNNCFWYCLSASLCNPRASSPYACVSSKECAAQTSLFLLPRLFQAISNHLKYRLIFLVFIRIFIEKYMIT